MSTDIKHYGVKGMRWGFRKSTSSSSGPSSRKVARGDKKFERQANTLGTALKVHNRAADLTNKNDVDRINNKPAYKGQDFTKDTPLRRKYYAEHQRAYLNNLEKAAGELGTNASGTKKYTILEKDNGDWDIVTVDIKKKVKHAEEELPSVRPVFDETGHILSLTVVSNTIEHGEALTAELLHYGVKGMRWGFRKSSSGVSIGRKAKAPSSADFKKAAAAKSKVKKGGGTHTLDNDELQSLIKRMNLEKQYAELSKRDKRKVVGAKFVGDVLGGVAKGQASRLGNQVAQDQIDKLIKRAAARRR